MHFADYRGSAQRGSNARARQPDENERKRSHYKKEPVVGSRCAANRNVQSYRDAKRQTERGYRPHLPPYLELGSHAERSFDLRRCLPLEQSPMTDEESVQRSPYRVRRHDGLVWQEDYGEQ